nr:hypothetical protein [Tanacetum cinerariifolium]
MTTLADKAILLGADNHPPMLEKDMYDSWKSQMEHYMMNRQHGRMILGSIKNGPLLWPTVKENGVTRPKKYSELSTTEAIQADCDVKVTNIILQGLPPEVYALTYMVIHTEKTEMMRLVVEIKYVGKITDVFDKATWSFDGLQPEQVDQNYVHALIKPHLHDIRVVSSKHEADQHYQFDIGHKFAPFRRKIVQELYVHLKLFQFHVVDVHIIEKQ